ncbi:Epsin-3, clathrin recruitment and traffic between the Golgi and endosome [Sporothrix epigloea]|uniref:Epsin-3, clathrin recruitment and traffic between the Golgi and endosome n=1 Tax=Sporothrix epigloea TaxID=1892477 RepID=A0ABP0D4C8_9PEZI
MDFSNLKESVANLTLYDLKAGVRKVQNAVMNYTEMESKVREATNNEPWGASSTLMQEIANGTFNYQTLNEIMPMIYRRFTEKSADEWRQIYKALQLLEFLIKHGSERVIDDARSHLTLLKLLRQFHFIDANGKDQGINVRNRAKELSELLGDVDRIRTERKKARANKGKYTGVGSSMGNSRFGGFGSDSGGFGGSSSGGGSSGYGGYSGGVYGDGGGFGGQGDYNEAGGSTSVGGSRAERFEEYDEYDEGESRTSAATTTAAPRASASGGSTRTGNRRTTGGAAGKRAASSATAAAAEPTKPKPKAPEVDLFSFDDPAPTTTTTAAPLASAADNDDDDFDDFQSAPAPVAPASNNALAGLAALASPPIATGTTSGAPLVAPQPVSAPKQVSLTDMMGISSISPPPASSGANYAAFRAPPPPQQQPSQQRTAPVSGYQPTQPNYYQSVQTQPLPGSGVATTSSVFPQSSTSSVFGRPSASAASNSTSAGMAALRPVVPSSTSASSGAKSTTAAATGSAGGDAFGSLWSTASTGIKKTSGPGAGKGPSMGQLAQEKSHAAIWGAPALSPASASSGYPQPTAPGGSSNGLDDLLG